MIHFEEITFEARQTFLQFPSTERSNYDVCDQTFHWELRHQRENMTSAGCSVHTEMPQRLLSILQFHRVHLNCPLQKFSFENVIFCAHIFHFSTIHYNSLREMLSEKRLGVMFCCLKKGSLLFSKQCKRFPYLLSPAIRSN